ncbi:MAG: hypothetical protein KIG14_02515, partial [Candidatus Sacchiramonaceae bacterium]|nr:hypothetical protein [Candidatus Saccharimonadaceae bacterium]
MIFSCSPYRQYELSQSGILPAKDINTNKQRGTVDKPTNTASSGRISFTEGDQVLPIPNLTEHQTRSWDEFVKYGLQEVFNELNPIDDYTGQK